MRQILNILLDTSIEHTKRLANEFCKVGTHVNIIDKNGRILEYCFITKESQDSFKTSPGGPVCSIELYHRNKVPLNRG